MLLTILLGLSMQAASLEPLNSQVQNDLATINYPQQRPQSDGVLDVAIIGGGQSGSAVAFALKKIGITNIKIFEEQRAGEEGPWKSFAHMKTLRSGKSLTGPAYHFPSLSFRAWFTSQYGEEAFEKLGQIPTKMWGDYVFWFREQLGIEVVQETKVSSIEPEEGFLKLYLNKGETVLCRKVVLATGRKGFGGAAIPDFLNEIPKSFWSHSSDLIDFSKLKGKEVAVIGAGPSAFDVAATALEQGASRVELLVRREVFNKNHPNGRLISPAALSGYQRLSDKEKFSLLSEQLKVGFSVPEPSLERVKGLNISLSLACSVIKAEIAKEKILLQTTKGKKEYDHVIAATGFAVDASRVEALKFYASNIQLWSDKGFEDPKAGKFPYLGQNQAFTEKVSGATPGLVDIHCFNYGAHVSFPHFTGDIPMLGFGGEQLAIKIAADLFEANKEAYLDELKVPREETYDITDYVNCS